MTNVNLLLPAGAATDTSKVPARTGVDRAWQREMEKAQAQQWFQEALPGREALKDHFRPQQRFDAATGPEASEDHVSRQQPLHDALSGHEAVHANDRTLPQTGRNDAGEFAGDQRDDRIQALSPYQSGVVPTLGGHAGGILPAPPAGLSAPSAPSAIAIGEARLARVSGAGLSTGFPSPTPIDARAAVRVGPVLPFPYPQSAPYAAPVSAAAGKPSQATVEERPAGTSPPRAAAGSEGEGMRVHVEHSPDGLRIWLGIDGPQASLAAQALLSELRRELGIAGQRVASVVCNGQTLFNPAEPGDASDAGGAYALLDSLPIHPPQEQ